MYLFDSQTIYIIFTNFVGKILLFLDKNVIHLNEQTQNKQISVKAHLHKYTN